MARFTSGDDVFYGGSDEKVIWALGGDDQVEIQFDRDSDPLATGVTIHGGAGNDLLVVGGLDNFSTIYGDAGNDRIYLDGAFQDEDPIGGQAYGGAGDDTITAGYGTFAEGGAGNDRITGFHVNGGAGDDTLQGNQVSGGSGDDVVVANLFAYDRYGAQPAVGLGDDGSDQVSGYIVDGGAGDDTVDARGYYDFEYGVGGAASGGAGSDVVYGIDVAGGAGNDLLHTSSTASGGQGHDVFFVFDPAAFYNEVGDASYNYNPILKDFTLGEDRIAIPSSYTFVKAFTGHPGEVLLDPVANITNVDVDGDGLSDTTLKGASRNLFINIAFDGSEADDQASGSGLFLGEGGNDTLTGAIGTDWLYGGQGNDVLSGASGDDLLVGNSGADTLNGGSGNDELDGGDGADTLLGGAGDDFIYGGAAADRIVGGSGNDQLLGEEGNDHINGGAGDDIITGGMGDDYILGGLGADRFVFSAADYARAGEFPYPDAPTRDTIADFTIGKDKIDLTAFGSNVPMSLTHQSDYDLITIDLNRNGTDDLRIRVQTLGGRLTLTDIVHNDTTVEGTANSDRLYGAFGNDTLSGLGGDDLLAGGDGSDQLIGGSGNDTLRGGAGADKLTGGLGQDFFYFDTVETSAESDTVADFSSGKDKLLFDSSAFAALAGQVSGRSLSAAEFGTGKFATTANQHIIYNSSNGALYYDPDGNGESDQVQIATLTFHPIVTSSDIIVI
ncbi:calcium-binding protein [Novosphingobium olei]|uniref:Peptidase M10 serralysin C-terminal domain-containing protein n=1 Tax=Novosphingobium olei TaxID=2728851 RepID=A0A7Y0BNB2_9SPHN|nr:calcium-binding protein [Novosphingobium olei]NML92866.1 hypothetical protein [Novosphingobium olei]